ncbi:alpha/beta hydrolase [Rothia amarae]|uniref:Alpha/beta fold hydrolase n=1 Tax=Rothia amarae TaxID=169480 RepID=A0A7H2BHS1_9MICC|nr:alpha/beta fold hydrolase [Rothia amarae]QNV39217.1 alpha/beta fold hydrolase [Rothia amarae]SIK90090.1 Thermostable monoacylglycerol lipase [Mycobacteroides abscessus subsp. abscessus]
MSSEIIHDPLSHPGSRPIGILLIHGFTGSPWSMRPLAEFFAEQDYPVEMILLPGHGSHWKDMMPVTHHDWMAEVDAAYWKLRQRASHVVIFGLSMGGMLALRESVRREVLGTVLINPFVQDPTVLLRFARLFSRFVASTKGITSDIAKPGADEGGYPRVPLKAAAELHALGKETRPLVRSLKAPVLYFRSAEDHVVSDKSHHFFHKHAECPVKFIELERSYHVATLDYDAPVILKNSLEFVQSLEADLKGHA